MSPLVLAWLITGAVIVYLVIGAFVTRAAGIFFNHPAPDSTLWFVIPLWPSTIAFMLLVTLFLVLWAIAKPKP